VSTEVDPRIPEKLFFRIGEVCDLINVQPHVLRYWESEFPMLAPQKNRAGQRVYRRKDVEMVFRIRDLLYEQKFTIAGAKKRLLEDLRRGGGAAKLAAMVRQASEAVEIENEPAPEPAVRSAPREPEMPRISPQAEKAVKRIKRGLDDLLTLLNSDARISG
jgi:DNA-binding transcriptional MerR regulator